MHIDNAPLEVKEAFEHVAKFHPTLKRCMFDEEGRWMYMDDDHNPFFFDTSSLTGEGIQVSILEEAVDSVDAHLPLIVWW